MEAMGSTVNGHTHVNNSRRQVNDGPDVLCPNCRWTWVMQGMLSGWVTIPVLEWMRLVNIAFENLVAHRFGTVPADCRDFQQPGGDYSPE